MKIEIRLLDTEAKRKGYPFDGFKQFLNTFIPGKPRTLPLWDVFSDYTTEGLKVLVFRIEVSSKYLKNIRGSI